MDSCIKCSGHITTQGYGEICLDGKRILEHRYEFKKHYPKINIDNKIIHHKCQNKTCINIEHLEVMSISDHTKKHGLKGVGKANSLKRKCKCGNKYDIFYGKVRNCSICRKKRNAEYYKKNKEKIDERNKKWVINNRDKVNALAKKYREQKRV